MNKKQAYLRAQMMGCHDLGLLVSEMGCWRPLTVLAGVRGGVGVGMAGGGLREGALSLMVVTGKDWASEQSLKEQQKWNVKMIVKMIIFAKARVGLNFSKMIIFGFILRSF